MGIVTCPRCTATTQANSIEEGRKLLDHSIGLILGRPCEDGRVEVFLTGDVTVVTEITPKDKKTLGKKSDSISKD